MTASTSIRTSESARRGPKRRQLSVPTLVMLCALAIIAVGPIVLFGFNALKSQNEMAQNPLGPPPSWRWRNFATAWSQANMAAGLTNSVVIVLGTIAIVVVVAGCGAYALARINVAGGTKFITYLLVSSALPTQMFLVPLFYIWTRIGLYDSRLGLIIIYSGLFSPFATLLLRSFLITLPKEFEEAARVDGASELSVLFRIILPSALPGLFTTALVTGLSAYNEFMFAVTFIQNSDLLPASTALFAFQQGYTKDYTLISAAGMIMIAPMLILFLVLQRRFVEGMASSGMGGA